MKRWLFAMIVGFTSTSEATTIPDESVHDPRIRYVEYKADEIFLINVRRGNLTRIILGKDEKIVESGGGFTHDCEKNVEWCVRAKKGSNQIWVKPYPGATHNNLEVATNKRDYSLEFHVLRDAGKGRWTRASSALSEEPFSRVIFHYKQPPIDLPNAYFSESRNGSIDDVTQYGKHERDSKVTLPATLSGDSSAADEMGESKPIPQNWNYSMNKTKGADHIVPEKVFDDGLFTYLEYPNNRPIPAFFVVDSTGQESRVVPHMRGDLAVIERLAPQIVLRRGKAVVGIWNDSYDFDGVSTESGVTVEDFERGLR